MSKLKENLVSAEKKLASHEEKYVLNEIERDSYVFMKPRFKEEILNLKATKQTETHWFNLP